MVHGDADVLDSIRRCFASLFTARAVSYREDMGIGQTDVALSACIQRMVRSDLASSGVMFTLDTDSGFRDVVYVTSAWGLGENVVQGRVIPDGYFVHKPRLRDGFRPVVGKTQVGAKELRMVYDAQNHRVTNVRTTDEERAQAVSHRRRGPRPGPLGDGHRRPLLGEAWRADTHGHRMGQGRHHRRAVHRAGPARDGPQPEVDERRPRVFRLTGTGTRCRRGPGRRRADRHRQGASHRGPARHEPAARRRRARDRDHRPRLGTDPQTGGCAGHRAGRPHLTRGDHRPRARHSGHRRAPATSMAGSSTTRPSPCRAPRARSAWSTTATCLSRSRSSTSPICRTTETDIMLNIGDPSDRLQVRPTALGWHRPGPDGVHLRQPRRGPPAGADPPRHARSGRAARGRRAHRRLRRPDRVPRRSGRPGGRDAGRGVLAPTGDPALQRLQDQRVRPPARRRGLRAGRAEPDDRMARCEPLLPP